VNCIVNRRVAGLLALSTLSIGPLAACADNGPADNGQTSTSLSPTTTLTSPPGALKTPLQTTESPATSSGGAAGGGSGG
jgi:hypothetical protein